MEKIYIRKGTHIRYLNGYLIMFSECKTISPMKINNKMLLLLLVISKENRVSEIKRIMSEVYFCSLDDVVSGLELLSPYITNEYYQESGNLANELNKLSVLFKEKKYIKNMKYHQVVKKKCPEMLSIYLTQLCGRRCIYCYADAKYNSEQKSGQHMSFELFQRIIKQAKELGVKRVELSGGDPFTIRNLDEYVELVLTNEMDCLLSTKHFVSLDMVERLYNIGLRKIQISIDSCDEKEADKLMGCQGAFQEVVETIRNFKKFDFEVTVRCVILKQNVKRIPSLIEFCDKKAVDVISFNMYGMSCGRHNDNYFVSEDEIIDLSHKIGNLNKQNLNIKIDYLAEPIIQFVKARSYGMKYKHYSRGICGAMTNSLTIRDDGKVVYCGNMSNIDEMVIGDLNVQSIDNVWNGSSYEKFKNPTIQDFRGTQCEKCEDFDYCRNKRCYFRTWLAYGKIFDKDPLCKYGDANFKTY